MIWYDDSNLLLQGHPDQIFTNLIIGNNTQALHSAREEALRLGLHPIILQNDIVGDVKSVSSDYADMVSSICQIMEGHLSEVEFLQDLTSMDQLKVNETKAKEIYKCVEDLGPRAIVLVGGGEPTVHVTGTGKGGRNQELALRFSLDLKERIKSRPELVKYEVVFLSAGTDGQDGSSDAAGAFGYPGIHFAFAHLRKKFAAVRKSVLMDVDREIDEEAMEMFKQFFGEWTHEVIFNFF